MKTSGYAVDHEKLQAGLDLRGQSEAQLERVRYPSMVYHDFKEIPPVLVHTLSFIEDRGILDKSHPYRNPAVNWHRFIIAAMRVLVGKLDGHPSHGGASTLATQIEKFRHSPYGRTATIAEKLHQCTPSGLVRQLRAIS